MKISLYYRNAAPTDPEAYQTLCDMLRQSKIEYAEVHEGEALPPCDYLFSIGGDGTLLSTVRFLHSYPSAEAFPPVLGINFGHLGFLTTVGKDHLRDTLDALLSARFTLEERTLLTSTLLPPASAAPAASALALNEVFLHRTENTSFLRTQLYADGQYVASYSGDGVIVATPTGSTAYSLSCGGPILSPESRCLTITPISPHTLTQRPLILTDSVHLCLRVEADCMLGTDSQRQLIASGSELHISLAPTRLRLVRIGEQNFFSAIREKLMWGTEVRKY